MSKELPYFKFIPTEYLLGTISFQKEKVQGTFTLVCCHYWQRHCNLTLVLLNQLLSKSQANVKQLIKADIVKHDIETDKINIDFLDEQWADLSILHDKRSKAGSIGGQASVKQRSTIAERVVKHLDIDKKEIRKEEDIDKEKEFLNSQIWLESVAMSLRLKNIEEVRGWVQKFILEMKAKETFNGRSVKELKSHCVSWIKVELEKLAKGKPNTVVDLVYKKPIQRDHESDMQKLLLKAKGI